VMDATELDPPALRIHELLTSICTATRPLAELELVRAELLACAGETLHDEAADAACAAVDDIDRVCASGDGSHLLKRAG
jgi:hypothetical protein